jgi:hypothetical protein
MNDRRSRRFKLAVTAIAAGCALLAGCGKAPQTELSCEKPVYAMRSAANFGDEESYLSCWLPQEKAHFRLAEDQSVGFLGNVFKRGDYESRLRVRIHDSHEVPESYIKETLEPDARARYGSPLTFTAAQCLKVDFRVQDNMDILSDSREIYVVKYCGVWYIYGEVIDSFSFARS